jgi:hypothetical protein
VGSTQGSEDMHLLLALIREVGLDPGIWLPQGGMESLSSFLPKGFL